MRWTNFLSCLPLSLPVFPCIVFVVSDDREVLVGNNEDYMDPDTYMWFVPGEGGTHGRVYFGYGNDYPQGGMNDAGLCFDGLALDEEAVVCATPKQAFAGNLADEAMAKCQTVAEVIELFEAHDKSALSVAQLLFADRHGDGVIIEGNAIVRKSANHLVATNYRQSQTPKERSTCPRFVSADEILGRPGSATVAACRKALAATHQEGEVSTIYSNIYDLKRGLIYLYHFHDFENVVEIDLAKELAKGAHKVTLASLFPETFAFRTFRERLVERVIAERESLRDKRADPATFKDFVGRYKHDGETTKFEFRVRLVQDTLVVSFDAEGGAELTPRGGTSFVAIAGAERVDFVFERGSDGTVHAATVTQEGASFRAERVE